MRNKIIVVILTLIVIAEVAIGVLRTRQVIQEAYNAPAPIVCNAKHWCI